MKRNISLITALAEKGWTWKELSARSGVASATLSRLVNCRAIPTRDTARSLSRSLGKPMSALFAAIHPGGRPKGGAR